MAEQVPTSGYQAAGGWVGTAQWFGQLLSEQMYTVPQAQSPCKGSHRKSSQSPIGGAEPTTHIPK